MRGAGLPDTFSHHVTAVDDDVSLHFVRGGSGGSVVFLLHGFPETWAEWRHVMPGLAEDHTVIAVDMKGAGDSSKPMSGYDKRTMARDMDALRSKLGFHRVHVVGHEIGAMVAYAWAAQFPETVASLTYVDAPLPGASFWGNHLDDPKLWHFAFHQARDIPEMLIRGNEYAYVEYFFRSRMYNLGALDHEQVDLYARAMAQPGATRSLLEWYRTFSQDAEDNRESSRTKLTMPVLALGGDGRWGPKIVGMLSEFAEDVRGGSIEDCGHWVPEERPAELLAELRAFLPRT